VPRSRQVVLDALTGVARRFPVHGLVEFDVGQASSRLAESEPPVSWTGFVIATVARAVALHPEVNARRAATACCSSTGLTSARRWNGTPARASYWAR